MAARNRGHRSVGPCPNRIPRTRQLVSSMLDGQGLPEISRELLKKMAEDPLENVTMGGTKEGKLTCHVYGQTAEVGPAGAT